ncbi:hypothetical protein BB561_006828 [Smittium simulii]|uniref:Uncharacterized protein n=1 Tax=Smittium simulii TaxID=133385 RepID=A0A2T9Y121_9FUNG|nr:hypothetical protein BB561_006828 [Smittium simulii]
MLQEAHKRSGEKAYVFQRVIEELEGRVYKQFERPLVATHIQILLEGLPIDGKNSVSLALVSMLQSGRAAPGDVITLYKAFHDSTNPPPTKVIRNTDITELLLKEVFNFYNEEEDSTVLPETLVDKYLWLISYSASTVDNIDDPVEKLELEKNRVELVQTLKQITKRFGSITLMADFNKMISWLLEIIRIPIAALLTTEWLRSVLTANNFNFLETYYRQGEIPMPIVLLEEIAFLQPQLRPQVFSVYVEIFTCRIEDFLPEVRISFQQVILGLMINLVQMGYGLAVSRFILDQLQQRTIDESLVVLYISKLLEMLAPPYISELSMLLLQLIVRVIPALIDTVGIHSNILYFLKCITSSSIKYTTGEISQPAIEASLLLLQLFSGLSE